MIIELSEYFAKDRYFSENAMQLRNIIDLINRSQLEENELKQIIEICNSKMKNSSNSISNSTRSTNNSLPTWEEAKQILSTNEDPKIRLKNFYERYYNENCKKYDDLLEQIKSLLLLDIKNLLALTEKDRYQNLSNGEANARIKSIISSEKSFKNECNLIKSRNLESLCNYCINNINKNLYDNSKVEKLKKLFKEALGLFISNGGDNNYELFEPKIDSTINNNTMRRSNNSPALGTVKKVLFPGIRYKATNRVTVPALVTLG